MLIRKDKRNFFYIINQKNEHMKIKVSNAVSLFKENGHDLKGILTMLVNAISAEVCYPAITPRELAISPVIDTVTIIEGKKVVYGLIEEALDKFQPDLEKASQRLQNFQKDYHELKVIDAYFENMGFWQLLFKRGKRRKYYRERRRELQEMRISVEELLNISFYKFSQVNGTLKQFKDGVKRFLEMK